MRAPPPGLTPPHAPPRRLPAVGARPERGRRGAGPARRALAALLLSLLAACPKPKPPAPAATADRPASQSQPAEPETPNRLDSLAYPEITAADKLAYAPRLAPAMLAAIEAAKIPLAVAPKIDAAPPLDEFLAAGLPPKAAEATPAGAEDLAGKARRALMGGPDSGAWRALSEAAGGPALTPLSPPGAIRISGRAIEIALEKERGLEWFPYLACKALLRSDAAARASLLGEALRGEYRWTPGEEELCLWALLGTREHLRGEIDREASRDPALLRLDEAAKANKVRGFALVEFLLPRRGTLAGLAPAELDAAVDYLLTLALAPRP